MKKLTTIIIILCFIVFKADAQRTCTCNTELTNWTGLIFPATNWTCVGTGDVTYVFPIGTGFTNSESTNFLMPAAYKVELQAGSRATLTKGSNDVNIEIQSGAKLNLSGTFNNALNLTIAGGGVNLFDITAGSMDLNVSAGRFIQAEATSIAVGNLSINYASESASSIKYASTGTVSKTVSAGTLDAEGSAVNLNVTQTGGTVRMKKMSVSNNALMSASAGNIEMEDFTVEKDFSLIATASAIVRAAALNLKKEAIIDMQGASSFEAYECATCLNEDKIALKSGAYKMATGTTSLFAKDLTINSIVKIASPASPSGPFIVAEYLPIELISYSANYIERKNKVKVEWSTATELNVKHYELYRSTDGKEYKAIYKLPVYENSFEQRNYQFDDHVNMIYSNNVYYRLRIVDNDESYEETEVAVVKITKKTESTAIVRPNPAKKHINLDTSFEIGMVEIYSALGQLVKQVEISSLTTRIEIADLEAGIYFARILARENSSTISFVKQ